MCGSCLRSEQACSRIGTASGRILYLLKSKFTPRSTIFFLAAGGGAGGGAAATGAGGGGGAGGDCCSVTLSPADAYFTYPTSEPPLLGPAGGCSYQMNHRPKAPTHTVSFNQEVSAAPPPL